MPSLVSSLRSQPIAFVDVETTGASCDLGDRVIELGIARVEDGRVVASYQQLIDPRRSLSPGIVALTGITPQMLAGQPSFADALPEALPLLEGAMVAGHNVGFDLSFLRGEWRRSGRELGSDLGEGTYVLDTVRMARRRFGRGGNGLQVLSRRLGIAPTAAHRALADVMTTLGVFERLIEPIGGWSAMLCDVFESQGTVLTLKPAPKREAAELPLEIAEALELRRPVRMSYTDASGHLSTRMVQPMSVRRLHGELVLVAHCHLRNERRHFKVARIAALDAATDDANSPTQPPEPLQSHLSPAPETPPATPE
jgi:DNA polymerase III epsilon subunit family exonuclease